MSITSEEIITRKKQNVYKINDNSWRSKLKQKYNSNLTILVPAYNEAGSISDTLKSLLKQTIPAEEIIVIDDHSTDNTGDIARSYGVMVIRPPFNTGSKAGAQNFALEHVKTEYTMAIDADTTLAEDSIEKLIKAIEEPGIAAACGFVTPRHVKTLWERGRYIEYLLAFTFYKPIQDYYEKPLISSGCFSIYRTKILKESGGWQTRTLAEDMDLTWSFYQKGYGVKFVQDAVCSPIEPHDYGFMKKQLRRWSHGFVQNVRLHWKKILHIPYLRWLVGVAMWDAVIASFAYLFLIPFLSIIVNPLFLIGYIIDAPAVLVPVFMKAIQRKEFFKALNSVPAFFVLRFVNGIFFLEAIWMELILGRSFKTYEKGH
jgi:biofilm PGA synthesis N-glycosyltransferase PgaC